MRGIRRGRPRRLAAPPAARVPAAGPDTAQAANERVDVWPATASGAGGRTATRGPAPRAPLAPGRGGDTAARTTTAAWTGTPGEGTGTGLPGRCPGVRDGFPADAARTRIRTRTGGGTRTRAFDAA